MITHREEFNSVQALGMGPDWNELEIVSIAELGPARPPEWLWRGYLARGGITLLTGFWKAGKTTLLSYLLRDLAEGGGLVESPVDAPVLIVSEESLSLWAERRDEVGIPDVVYFLKRPTFARPDRAEWLGTIDYIRQLVESQSIRLVVFDTLPSVWPVLNENDAGETLEALTPLRGLSEAGAAVLLMHHPRKGDGTNGTATRGSGAMPGFVDVLVELRRYDGAEAGDTRRTLTAMGRFDGIPPETIIDLGPDGFTVLGERAQVKKSDFAERVARLLPETGEGWTVDELREAWPSESKPGRVKLLNTLNMGASDGRWRATGRGVRGDPRRFGGSADAQDSIPIGSTPRGETETNPSPDVQGGLYPRGTDYR